MRPPVIPMLRKMSSITRPSLSKVTPCQELMSSDKPQLELESILHLAPSVAS